MSARVTTPLREEGKRVTTPLRGEGKNGAGMTEVWSVERTEEIGVSGYGTVRAAFPGREA